MNQSEVSYQYTLDYATLNYSNLRISQISSQLSGHSPYYPDYGYSYLDYLDLLYCITEIKREKFSGKKTHFKN